MDEFRSALRRVDVVSFDLFDTLVYRPGFFSPKDLFYVVGDRIGELLGWDIPNFSELRIQAEKNARVRAWGGGREDVALAEIYDELGRRLKIDAKRSHRLREIELDVERSALRPQEVGRQLFDVAQEEKKEIVLVSDTYFDQGFLAEVLTATGYQGELPIYASSTYGKTKDDGTLYDRVLADMGIRPGRLLHVGDSLHSDCKMALGRGIRSFVLPTDKSRLKSLHSVGDVPSGNLFSSIVFSRFSEQYWRETPGPEGVLGRTSLRLGLLYLAFAAWLKERITAEGARTVYFASRDGRIMKRFFDLVSKGHGIEVESRYLYVSRMALYPSLVFSEPDVARRLFAHSWDGLSIQDAVKRVSLDYKKCRTLLSRHGFSDSGRVAERGESDEFAGFLTAVWSMVKRNNEKPYKLIIDYLRQEGLLNEEPAAFVDIGWHGSLQNSILKLLGHLGIKKELSGYYLATFKEPIGASADFRAAGYLLNNDRPKWLSWLVRSGPSLLELFHGTEHGSVLRYRKKGRRVVPVLEDDAEDLRQFRAMIEPVQENAFLWVSEMLEDLRGLAIEPPPPALVARIALRVLYDPTADEARMFGRLKHASDFGAERKSVTGVSEWDLSRLGDQKSFADGTVPLWLPGFRALKHIKANVT